MWPVTFIVGFGPCQLLEHLPACRRYPAVVQLVLASSKLTTQARAIHYVNFFFSRKGGGGEGWLAHLGLLILGVVLPVDVASGGIVRGAQRGIADLRREVVFEVEEARLAHVACLCAGLADHRRLETHARARVPTEDGKRARARPAFSSKLLFRLLYKQKEKMKGKKRMSIRGQRGGGEGEGEC